MKLKKRMGDSLCSILRDLDEPQSVLLLLKHCHVPKLNHLATTVVPTHLSKAAVIHDNLTKSTFADIIGLEQIEDTKWKQATIKLKFGGFGLTLYQQLLPAAFVAVWVQSLKELPNRFSTFQNLRQKFLTPCAEVSSIGYSLQKAVECLPPRMNDGQCHYISYFGRHDVESPKTTTSPHSRYSWETVCRTYEESEVR